MRQAARLVAVVGASLLSACGGGSSGSGTNSTLSSSAAPSQSLYSIGGTLSGLTASGLVLLDNGSDALSVPADASSFTFTTLLSAGSTYDVSVATQPTGETCSVSAGSGTANSNISVAVSCTPTSAGGYTVGGTISGYQSSGLVLEDNGGNALSVPAGAASFLFTTPLSAGTAYDISVATQPSGETCTVSHGSGTANSNVMNVTVDCVASYIIGGTVSGLDSGTLVLEDNGGDELVVQAGAGSFSFPTAVITGDTYNVAIAAEPTTLVCTVSDGSGTASAAVTGVAVSCSGSSGGSNVVPLTVGPGPASASNQTFNIPYVSVQVCDQNGSCTTIPDVLVDTGSSGLRLMASTLTNAGLSLSAEPDPGNPNNTIYECLPFADGYAWGAVATASVTVGAETSTSAIPIQIIDDDGAGPSAPNNARGPTCASGTALNGVNAFDANGVLGVSTADQDCGDTCTEDADNAVYWTCVTASGSCSSTTFTAQVANPVASFPTGDNNGVVIELSSIASTGAATAGGSLVLGISSSSLSGATVLTTNSAGEFTTTFPASGGSQLTGFVDSGSNGLYFDDATLQSEECSGGVFYCPPETVSLSATNEGTHSTTSTVTFQVADLATIDASDFAIDDVAGTGLTIDGSDGFFDWGLPFFYGRDVFVAIEGATVQGSSDGPFIAY